MARRIVVDVNDLVDEWRQKTNLLSDYFGDLDQLTTSVDSDLVGAINSVRLNEKDSATVDAMIDSAIFNSVDQEYFPLTTPRYGDSSIDSNAIQQNIIKTRHFTLGSVDTTIIANNGVATINIADSAVSTSKIANLGVTAAKVANNTLSSSKFSSPVTLNIYDSGGSIVKTLHSPGS